MTVAVPELVLQLPLLLLVLWRVAGWRRSGLSSSFPPQLLLAYHGLLRVGNLGEGTILFAEGFGPSLASSLMIVRSGCMFLGSG